MGGREAAVGPGLLVEDVVLGGAGERGGVAAEGERRVADGEGGLAQAVQAPGLGVAVAHGAEQVERGGEVGGGGLGIAGGEFGGGE